MSKHAVILLLFFITALNLGEPAVTKGLKIDNAYLANPASGLISRPLITQGYLLNRGYVSRPDLKTQNRPSNSRTLLKTVVTAYTSSPEETDETPFITASGNYAQFGVAAANFLPLGTQIRLPKLFGEQIFVVEDRLNSRYNNRVDIWLPAKNDAQNFGVKVSEIEIF
ncbi:3D domain-containing protein [Candidatus Wolfebacteria bacterium]|nr:3D domain-containing protein [Candidatus Wolfebacteria bacterium]